MMRKSSWMTAIDYAYGMSVAELAVRERCSEQRIYQRLSNATVGLFGTNRSTELRKCPERTVGRIKDYLNRPRYIERGKAETPEEFFYELLNEPRTRND